MTFDSRGQTVIADCSNHRVRRLSLVKQLNGSFQAIVSTLAGNGEDVSQDSRNPLMASFSSMCGICVDGDDNVYVVETNDSGIRMIDAITGAVRTIVGNGALSSFSDPSIIIYEPRIQSLFVGEIGSIRMIDLKTKEVITIFQLHEKYYSLCPSSLAVEVVEKSIDYVLHIQQLPLFSCWPPGLLDVVIAYIPRILSLLIADSHNNCVQRIVHSTS